MFTLETSLTMDVTAPSGRLVTVVIATTPELTPDLAGTIPERRASWTVTACEEIATETVSPEGVEITGTTVTGLGTTTMSAPLSSSKEDLSKPGLLLLP